MVATRRRSASAIPTDSTQPHQTLHRNSPFPTSSGERWASPTQSPKTPTPTVAGVAVPAARNRRTQADLSEPTHNRKTPDFTFPGVAGSASFLIPKSVVLHDWWLVKVEGRRVAVGGFASRERQGVRVFCSAAITKRLNTTTLETTDDITVTISGLINRSRTHQNGFPLEVCDHFLLGFPYYWEDYAAKCYNEQSPTAKLTTPSASHSGDSQSVSLDDLPVTRARDLLMSVTGDSDTGIVKKTILDCILGKLPKQAVEDPPTARKAPRTEMKRGKADKMPYTPSNASVMEFDGASPRARVATRSMTRLSHLKQEDDLRIKTRGFREAEK